MWHRGAVLLVCALTIAEGRPAAQADALFSFHSNPWLNLHHILRAKGEGAPLPADMPEPDRAAWAAGIEAYAPYATRDPLFDEELIAIKEALRTAEERTSLDGLSIDSSVKATLEMLFHERSHAWGRVLASAIFSAAEQQGVKVPRQLPHAVLFYTAGELTARELKTHGIDYTHFAQGGIYKAMCGVDCQERMAVHWTPHLEGQRSIVDAASALVGAFKETK